MATKTNTIHKVQEWVVNSDGNYDKVFKYTTADLVYRSSMDTTIEQYLSNLDSINVTKNNFATIFKNLDSAEIDTLFTNELFTSKLDAQTINAISVNASTISAELVTTDTVKATLIDADTGKFKSVMTDAMTAEYGNISNLTTDVANIQNLLAGTIGADSELVINLSSTNAKIDSAWISNIVAAQLSVSDLKAGDIVISDSLKIRSSDSNFVMNGSVMQFLDSSGNVGIQIGYDNSTSPSMIINDSNGTALFNSSGVTANAIADELIVNDMIKDGTVSTDKLAFTVETDDDGNLITSISNVYDGSGNNFGVEYTTFKTTTNSTLSDLDDKIDDATPYRIEIETTNGNIFKRKDVNTSLICHVFHGNEDITDDLDSSLFHWSKVTNEGLIDEEWALSHDKVKSINITTSDLTVRSTFRCTVDGIFE